MSTPETRYRRLLVLYPSDFRREYEDEILGVLMTDDRKGPGQVVDLIRAALTVRLQRVTGAVEWRRAAYLVQLFGAILLLALAVRRTIGFAVLPVIRPDWILAQPALVDGMRLGGWALVVAAALLGWRMLGLTGAAIGLAGEVASPLRYYLDTPATVLNAYWIIVTATIVLVAGLVAHRGGTRPRGVTAVVAAGLFLALDGVMPWYLGSYRVVYVLSLAAAGLLLIAALRQEPVMRWWLAVWVAPVAVSAPMVGVGFAGFREYNRGHPESLLLIDGVQWATLVLVPLFVLVVATLAMARFRGRPVGTK